MADENNEHQKQQYQQRNSNGQATKLLLGSGGSLFVIASIFWAGATYNRVEGIEKNLALIQVQLTKLGDFQALQERTLEQQRRLEKIEDFMTNWKSKVKEN